MSFNLPVSREALEVEHWPACALDRTGHIVYVNSAWDRVAVSANGPLAAEVLGTRWIDHITGEELRTWYEDLLARVLDSGAGESHTCDCNTPDHYRLFSSRFEPLRKRSSPDMVGLLVLASMLEEAPIGERYKIGTTNTLRYLSAEGIVLQCSGCRRVRVAGGPPYVWELVPEYVLEHLDGVSHGICRICMENYYGLPARVRT